MGFTEGILLGFIIGSLAGGGYCVWFITSLKKQGYIKFDITEKFKKYIKDG